MFCWESFIWRAADVSGGFGIIQIDGGSFFQELRQKTLYRAKMLELKHFEYGPCWVPFYPQTPPMTATIQPLIDSLQCCTQLKVFVLHHCTSVNFDVLMMSLPASVEAIVFNDCRFEMKWNEVHQQASEELKLMTNLKVVRFINGNCLKCFALLGQEAQLYSFLCSSHHP